MSTCNGKAESASVSARTSFQRTLCPSAKSFGSILSSSIIFPDRATTSFFHSSLPTLAMGVLSVR